MYSFGKIVHFGSHTIVNKIKRQGQCTKDIQLFSLVLQLFSLVVQLFNGCTAFQKYTYEDHRICTALEKLYILVQTPLSMKIRVMDSVPKSTDFFFSCTAFYWLPLQKMGIQNVYFKYTFSVHSFKCISVVYIVSTSFADVQKMYNMCLYVKYTLFVMYLKCIVCICT